MHENEYFLLEGRRPLRPPLESFTAPELKFFIFFSGISGKVGKKIAWRIYFWWTSVYLIWHVWWTVCWHLTTTTCWFMSSEFFCRQVWIRTSVSGGSKVALPVCAPRSVADLRGRSLCAPPTDQNYFNFTRIFWLGFVPPPVSSSASALVSNHATHFFMLSGMSAVSIHDKYVNFVWELTSIMKIRTSKAGDSKRARNKLKTIEVLLLSAFYRPHPKDEGRLCMSVCLQGGTRPGPDWGGGRTWPEPYGGYPARYPSAGYPLAMVQIRGGRVPG